MIDWYWFYLFFFIKIDYFFLESKTVHLWCQDGIYWILVHNKKCTWILSIQHVAHAATVNATSSLPFSIDTIQDFFSNFRIKCQLNFLADQRTFGRWRLKNPDFWLSKSIFYVKNYPNLSKFFFSLKNINLGASLLLLTFFENFNF